MKISCGNIDILTLFLFDICFRLVCFIGRTFLQFLLSMSMSVTMSVTMAVAVSVATFVFDMATFVRMAVVMIMVMSWSLMKNVD